MTPKISLLTRYFQFEEKLLIWVADMVEQIIKAISKTIKRRVE